jgi:hypothetical protein
MLQSAGEAATLKATTVGRSRHAMAGDGHRAWTPCCAKLQGRSTAMLKGERESKGRE